MQPNVNFKTHFPKAIENITLHLVVHFSTRNFAETYFG